MTELPEAYPMPSFVTLEVADADATSRWYQDVLGFQHVFTIPGPGGKALMIHLRWRKYADLLVRSGAPADGLKGVGVGLNYMVSADIDALAERARAGGTVFLREIGDRPWNARDFVVADPDGFALTFTFGPLDHDRTLDEVITKASAAA